MKEEVLALFFQLVFNFFLHINKKSKWSTTPPPRVKIRIITDHAGANQLASQIESFHKNSIPVRTHIGNGLMHNKFIILDKKVIITGSFNFTTSAIVDNHENVVVTDQLDIVGQYVSRFEKLWGLFDYNQDKKIKG